MLYRFRSRSYQGRSYRTLRSEDPDKMITALYERLSRDDELQGESMSIGNQKQMLMDYAIRNELPNLVHFTDDGYSGTNFDRLGFISMMDAVAEGRIGTIIVKDMSRVGRDYVKVGILMEELREKKVRLISISDNIDTFAEDDGYTAFRNIINEMYARDTSQKIRSVLHNKGLSGKPLTSKCPYGYQKNPNDKDDWIVDQEAAVVIRKIFNMTIAGMSTGQIARELNASKIDIPTVHQAKQGQGTSALERHPDPYIWSSTTVRNILTRREYLGHTVNFRTKKHFKDKNSHYVPEDQWVEFENTHPAIIDPNTFEEAGKRRKKKVVGAALEPHPLTGLVICADCGVQMYSIKRKGNDPVYNFVCSSYMKRPIGTICWTAHCTSSLALEAAIREKLDWLKSIAKEKGIGVIDDLYEAQGKTGCLALRDVLLEKITDMNVRIEELDRLLDQLTKDHKAGKVPATRYSILSSSYEKQLSSLKETIRKFEALAANSSDDCNADEFLEFLLQYRHDDPIDYTGLRRFLKKIIVHERKERYSRKCAHNIEVIFK